MGRLGRNGLRPVAAVGAALALALVGRALAAGSAAAAARAAGNAGPPPQVRVVPADLEDVEHMCALLTACDKLPLPAGLVPHDFVGCTRALHAELASPAAVTFSL